MIQYGNIAALFINTETTALQVFYLGHCCFCLNFRIPSIPSSLLSSFVFVQILIVDNPTRVLALIYLTTAIYAIQNHQNHSPHYGCITAQRMGGDKQIYMYKYHTNTQCSVKSCHTPIMGLVQPRLLLLPQKRRRGKMIIGSQIIPIHCRTNIVDSLG